MIMVCRAGDCFLIADQIHKTFPRAGHDSQVADTQGAHLGKIVFALCEVHLRPHAGVVLVGQAIHLSGRRLLLRFANDFLRPSILVVTDLPSLQPDLLAESVILLPCTGTARFWASKRRRQSGIQFVLPFESPGLLPVVVINVIHIAAAAVKKHGYQAVAIQARKALRHIAGKIRGIQPVVAGKNAGCWGNSPGRDGTIFLLDGQAGNLVVHGHPTLPRRSQGPIRPNSMCVLPSLQRNRRVKESRGSALAPKVKREGLSC